MKQVNFSGEVHATLIRTSSLSINIENHSDTSITWIKFHKIAHMYRYVRKKETIKSSLLIQCLHVNFGSTKSEETLPATPNLSMPLQTTMHKYPETVSEELKNIHPWTYQVWNSDEIIFDPNGSSRKVVFTYKLFTGDRMWRNQTGETASFWYTALVLTISNDQCFMTLVIVHQA